MADPLERPDREFIVWESKNLNWCLTTTGCLFGAHYWEMYQLTPTTEVALPRDKKPHIKARDLSYGDRNLVPFDWHPIPKYVAQAVLKHRPVRAEIEGIAV